MSDWVLEGKKEMDKSIARIEEEIEEVKDITSLMDEVVVMMAEEELVEFRVLDEDGKAWKLTKEEK